jgi:thiol-disulfide isomerase/thioredoxin
VIAWALLAATLAGDVNAADVHEAVAARRGRPVVLNFWASWCVPCVKEFPVLVALARERADVAVLSVSVDDASDRAAVLAVLDEQKPPFPVYLKGAWADDTFIDQIDKDWSGAVPFTMIFDAEGRKAAVLEGEHTRADIERALSRAAPPPPE